MKIKWIRKAVLLALLLAILASSVPGAMAAHEALAPDEVPTLQQTAGANFCVPTSGQITQRFATHEALDIASGQAAGVAPIYAAHAGQVVFVGPAHAKCNYVYAVAIRYDGQINGEYYVLTLYNHMGHWDGKTFTSYVKVQVGDQVDKGQLIGYQGDAPMGVCNTETSGVHGHFAVYEKAQPFRDQYSDWGDSCSGLFFETGGTSPACPPLPNAAKAANPELPRYLGALPASVTETCDEPPTPPTADAGGPYTANEGETVILNASGSSDPDGMIVSYEWDLDGDGEYDDATGQTSSWTWGDDYAGNIGLKVTDDGGATSTDTTTVTISNVAPTVEAGPDQTVFRNDVVALSGAWTDPAGSLDELYSWTWDVTGDGITDSSGSASYGSVVSASTSFATEGTYTLTFAVTDKDGGADSDSIMVKVLNRPPNCSAATPSIETIWPPNHKFVPVNILRVTDPEGDPVSITINSIRQDEPVDTVGNGRFSPDGKGIGTDTAHVRAERVGTKKAPGNGRVYHIGFTADDGHGGSCSRKVLVGVPHDRKDISPVNDGALYNSTELAP